MSPSHQPSVLRSCSWTSFLDYILQSHAHPSTVVVCSTRDEFLQEALEACQVESQSQQTPHYSLLRPTIHLIATSTTVKLAFAPSLAHLRAYLAVYMSAEASDGPAVIYDRPGKRIPSLAILNSLQLHRLSGDLSAQGISRTLAAAVEAAARNDMRLLIAECSVCDQDATTERQVQGQGPYNDLWGEQIPLLNGSLRFGADQRAWAGRTVQLDQVFGRWCKFISLGEVIHSV